MSLIEDDEYVCGRKYCFSCLKDTYIHENIRENGLCPFCLGACICTRCLRNEKIARFKNMYSLLGGDLARIQEGSELEQLQAKGEELVQRGRGRPKKYAISHTTVNITQKKLRKFDEKENYAVKGLLGKKKRQNNPYSIWYLAIDKLNATTAATTRNSRSTRSERRREGWVVLEPTRYRFGYRRNMSRCSDG
jgi:hypothetical protein